MRTFDRVQETTTTTGTGAISLGGAVSGFKAFSTVLGNGDRVAYSIQLGNDWETGEGIYNASTLTRDTVFSSSNADALVSFPAGSKLVWADLPAILLIDLGVIFGLRQANIPQ